MSSLTGFFWRRPTDHWALTSKRQLLCSLLPSGTSCLMFDNNAFSRQP